ncbi:MAG: hypothetical protein ACKPKO_15325, partial [Candidatus Fonsibacter sp.]
VWNPDLQVWSMAPGANLRQAFELDVVQSKDTVVEDCLRTLLSVRYLEFVVRFYDDSGLQPSQLPQAMNTTEAISSR